MDLISYLVTAEACDAPKARHGKLKNIHSFVLCVFSPSSFGSGVVRTVTGMFCNVTLVLFAPSLLIVLRVKQQSHSTVWYFKKNKLSFSCF